MALRPPPEPDKLLADWMEWERGDEPPGRVIANLKTHGIREVLEALVEQGWVAPMTPPTSTPTPAPTSTDA